MKQLLKKIKINTSITLVTGLHIGGNSENVEIGGIDLPVIKLAIKDNQPYIPGSSLKGKMRCLLEQTEGASEIGMS
jgi:CRISPR-associated protein Csm3